MKLITLCYHDLMVGTDGNASGFPTASSATYKLDPGLFEDHVRAIRGSGRETSLTFDDGGSSACRIGDILERHGLRGHFFVPTDYIGKVGFLNAGEIADLRRRGHFIGSHSCSHRGRMSSKPWDVLLREWRDSASILSGLLGEAVTSGSVPSGFYSPRVAEAAAAAGLKLIYTLEPTTAAETVAGCLVAGRYTIRRWHSAAYAGAIAAGARLPRLRQQAAWKAKRALKATPFYTGLRERYFTARSAR